MIKEYINNKISSYGTKKTEIGIGGFTLLINLEESIELSSDVTTNYVESGDYINDHIVSKPITLTFSGEAGDIHVKESVTFQDYKKLAGTVGRLTPYFPKRTATQVSRIFGFINTVGDTITKLDGYINDGLSLYNFVMGKNADKAKTPQELFIEFFTMIYENRLYINVESFGKVYENMAMTSLTIRRTDKAFISYSMSFTQLRFAETTAVKVKKGKGLKNGKKKGNNEKQTANKKDKGSGNGNPVRDKSALARMKSAIMGG